MQPRVHHLPELAEPLEASSISDQVDRILRSPSFANKNQLRKLLEILFVSIDSQTTLKPDRVIKELWPDESKTKRSADLATEMTRLRNALETYYNGEGKADPIIISLPNRAVAASDGRQEKRWIVAKPRGEDELHSPAPAENVRVPKGLAIAAIIAALGVVVYFSVRMLTLDDQPQSGRLDGSILRVMDGQGKELWSKSFPEGFSPDYYAQGLASRIWFGVLDEKSRTEVLFLYHPGLDPGSHSTTLICYSDRGKEKWRWTPGRELPELEGLPATFVVKGLGVLKARTGQPSRIVVSSIHLPLYPHQIAMLDSRGKTISEYWHSGHLFYLTLADLDGDGREQIIASGINNGYHQATLIMLDPDRVYGASVEAARPEVQIHGMGVPAERLRLLFPRSDLNKALYTYNEGQDVSVGNSGIRLNVRECQQRDGCKILYVFDKNFHLISASDGDQFRDAHAEFYLRGKDAHPFTAKEEAEFQKIRCLAGCKSDFLPIQNH